MVRAGVRQGRHADRTRVGAVARVACLLLSGVLILQGLAYGVGFFLDPVSGLGEFASPPRAGNDDLAIALIGLVGVAMIGAAALLTWAAILLFKDDPFAPWMTMLVGAVYVLAGLSSYRVGWMWDASFYAGSGALLFMLSVAVHRLRREAAGTGIQSDSL